MRVPMYVAAAIGVLALAPEWTRVVLASSASVLLECLPYLAASVVLAPILGRFAQVATAFAGCGCGGAPGALSLPATVATMALFGPLVAIARFTAALLVRRFGDRDTRAHAPALLDEVHRLVPSAVLCGIVVSILPSIHLAVVAPIVLFVVGFAIGVWATPCTLGGIAFASSVHASAPALAYGVLSSSGIITLRVHHLVDRVRDRFVARGRDVRPSAHDDAARNLFAHLRVPGVAVPLALLAIVVIGAPMPALRANETSLADLYPGERLSFTGMYAHGTLVRYAITCCRADATPVSISLVRDVRVHDGTWLHAEGVIVRKGERLALSPSDIAPMSPPSDPFLYR